MHSSNTITIATLVFTLLTVGALPDALAQELSATDNGVRKDVSIMIETDPVTFALGGFAAHIRRPLATYPAVVVGAGVYGMKFPKLMVEMHRDNSGKGWEQELDAGYGAFLDYYVNGEQPRGFFVGSQLALQRFEVSIDRSAEVAQFSSVMGMARAGYLWRPFERSGFYIMPWGGVGANLALGAPDSVAGDEFLPQRFAGFGTVHVGFQL